MVVVGVYRIPRSDWKPLFERGSVKSKNFVGVIPVLGRLFPRFAVEAVWMAVEVWADRTAVGDWKLLFGGGSVKAINCVAVLTSDESLAGRSRIDGNLPEEPSGLAMERNDFRSKSDMTEVI